MTEITSKLSSALADRYKIERHLGEGGMATVYLAEDLKHERKVALKVLKPELAAVLGAERFVQEIKTTANLQHPHILPLFDSGEADSFLYYVMPFIDGETLRDKLNRETQLGIEEAVSITTDIADALDYAHQQGVIHRDIKPENILIHNGRPMVADFGIALAVSAAAGGRMTETGFSLGTPHYMSPEQATAEKDLTNRSDIYSLGCVLYEMLMWALTRPVVPRTVVRYVLTMSPDEQPIIGVGPSGSAVTVSPAGSRLVYVGPGEGGPQLWVRDRDKLRGEPIPGTEGGRQPFFSPAGSQVGFIDQDQLKTVSLGGEPPVTLVDGGVSGLGGAWGANGYLYFTTQPANGLARVLAAAGGDPEPVSLPDTASGVRRHGWPSALPNGKGVLFTMEYGAGFSSSDRDSIAVLDVGGGEYRALVNGIRGYYVPTGHLVFVRYDGTLMAALFDQNKLELTGPAVPLLPGMPVLQGPAVTLSEDGRLVYATVGKGSSWELVWVDRTGHATQVEDGWEINTPSNTGPKLSPDDSHIALSILDDDANDIDVWIRELGGGAFTRLTFGGRASRPDWSPDGRSVLYIRTTVQGNFVVRTRPANGTGSPETLMDWEMPWSEAVWSPDGQWLVARTNRPHADIFGFRPGIDSVPVPLIAEDWDEMALALSPDGRWIAYVSNESGNTEVYVRPFPNTDDGKWQVSSDGGREPVWAHNGRELFYKNADAELVAVTYTVDPSFRRSTREVLFTILPGDSYNRNRARYDITKDDERFLMFRRLGPGATVRFVVVENFFEELKAKVGN